MRRILISSTLSLLFTKTWLFHLSCTSIIISAEDIIGGSIILAQQEKARDEATTSIQTTKNNADEITVIDDFNKDYQDFLSNNDVGNDDGSITNEESNDGNEKRIKTKNPIFENGLLVLHQDNLVETIMGKTLKFNTNQDTNYTLLLLAFNEPWCPHSKELIDKLESASLMIQDKFDTTTIHNGHLFTTSHGNNISPPFLAKMDTSVFDIDDLIDFYNLFDSSDNSLPMLKFVFIKQNDDGDDIDEDQHHHQGTQDGYDDEISGDSSTASDDINGEFDVPTEMENDGKERTIIDYVGGTNTVEEIVETVMHYWYRFVLSSYISQDSLQALTKDFESLSDDIPNEGAAKEMDDDIVFDAMIQRPHRSIYTFSDLDSLILFVHKQNDLFHPVVQDLASVSEREEMYIRQLLAPAENKIDPFLGFVQCRSKSLLPSANKSDLYLQFDELAQTFVYRRDVAFFVIVSDNCHWIDAMEENLFENPSYEQKLSKHDGHVRVLKFHAPRFDDDIEGKTWMFGNRFPQDHNDIHPLTMSQFAVIQSTPSILWFDKSSSASLAFPMYRRTHLVLFVDMHTSRLRDGSFQYSSSVFEQSRNAISQLRKAASNLHENRPLQDVVFLIVPSTEIQILTTFGIDIWSVIDFECTQSDSKNCHPESITTLPMAMITSRIENNSTMLRYYLETEKILSGTQTIEMFLSDYFNRSLESFLKSESHGIDYSSSIQRLTAATFDKLLTTQANRHSIIYFYAPYCGHCKRFDIIWKEFADLLHELKWDTMIDMMTIDITKNDVMHNNIDINEIPKVYLFPKDMSATKIIEVDLKRVHDPYSIIEWLIESSVFNEELLLKEMIKQSSDY